MEEEQHEIHNEGWKKKKIIHNEGSKQQMKQIMERVSTMKKIIRNESEGCKRGRLREVY